MCFMSPWFYRILNSQAVLALFFKSWNCLHKRNNLENSVSCLLRRWYPAIEENNSDACYKRIFIVILKRTDCAITLVFIDGSVNDIVQLFDLNETHCKTF